MTAITDETQVLARETASAEQTIPGKRSRFPVLAAHVAAGCEGKYDVGQLKIGVCGAGQFASAFIPLFGAYPLVRGVALAEVLPARRRTVGPLRHFRNVRITGRSLSQRRRRGCPFPLTLAARSASGAGMRAGKHVYSAVPAAITLNEVCDLHNRECAGQPLPRALNGLTPAGATGIAVMRPEKRSADAHRALAQLGNLHPDLRATLARFASFATLLREQGEEGSAASLDQWMADAASSEVGEMRTFATKLRGTGTQ